MLRRTLLISGLVGLCSADIVLSVAAPTDMDAYLDVLSMAWGRVYPQLAAQLATAQAQVPAEYSYLLKILSVTAVPSDFDAAWARGFVENAQRIGPTTIFARDIDGAGDLAPTGVVTTEGDSVATVTVPMDRPTIVVAVNGNVARNEKSVVAGSSSEEGSSSEGAVSGSSPGSHSSDSSSSGAEVLRVPGLVAFALVSAAAVSSFF
ncbi:hypothetical protein FBU31_001078 [Coemansia sp. 'formosensis']|nr:hypothetical protein FBU31_001078 [Coemansia sp. 'formosensis']